MALERIRSKNFDKLREMEGQADTTALGAYFWLTFSRFVPQRHDVATSIASPDDGSWLIVVGIHDVKDPRPALEIRLNGRIFDTHTTETHQLTLPDMHPSQMQPPNQTDSFRIIR